MQAPELVRGLVLYETPIAWAPGWDDTAMRRVLAEPDPVCRLRAAAGWLRTLYEAGFDVVLIFDGAMDEDEATRELLRGKLAGRNRVVAAG